MNAANHTHSYRLNLDPTHNGKHAYFAGGLWHGTTLTKEPEKIMKQLVWRKVLVLLTQPYHLKPLSGLHTSPMKTSSRISKS